MPTEQQIIYDDKGIVDFCRYTGDTNDIHNPEKMDGLPVIVPGMYTVSSALNLANDHLKQINSIGVKFTDMLLSGDTALIKSEKTSDNPLEIRLSASYAGGKDTLSNDGSYSKIARLNGLHPNFFGSFEGRDERTPFTGSDLEDYGQLIAANDEVTRNLLYAICMISPTFIEGVKTPQSEVQKTTKDMLDKKILPGYESIEISMPGGINEEAIRSITKDEGHLSYHISGGKEIEPGRRYSFRANCSIDDTIIYEAQFTIAMLPERAAKIFVKRRSRNK